MGFVDELSETLSGTGCLNFLEALWSFIAPPPVGLFVAGRLEVLVEVIACCGIAFWRIDAGRPSSPGAPTRRCFVDVFGR